jgi:hypothetical protein
MGAARIHNPVNLERSSTLTTHLTGIKILLTGRVRWRMSLQFIGEIGVYLPDRDAVKIIALSGDHVVECYATRQALDALGCPDCDDGTEMVRAFQRARDAVEIAAMVKYRRSLCPVLQIYINAEDIASVLPASAA